MTEFAYALDALIKVLRGALFFTGVGVAALAGLAYMVRTRRLSPFGAVGRFVRGSVDPLFLPMERRVVRRGGRPSTAPWWTVGLVVVGGIILLSLLGFVRDQILTAASALSRGPGGMLVLLVHWTFAVLQIALLVRVLSSWFAGAAHSPWVRWTYPLTDWLLRPLRRIIPPLGMMDVSPIVAYFVLNIAEKLVLGAMIR
jgi:YggT family protein